MQNRKERYIINSVLLSTGNNNWATPAWFFNRLNSIFHFTLDPCADEINAKCPKHFTEQDNGLAQVWREQVVFCNPPYGKKTKDKPGQADWIEKCWKESKEHHITTVMLIPARTDTKSQHKYIFPYAKYIGFIKGRLKFGGQNDAAPFPSEVVVFTEENFDQEIQSLSDLGYWIKLK